MKVSSLIRFLPLLAAPAALAQTTVVHDVFADGDRTTQNIAGNSMAWFYSRTQTATADTTGVSFTSTNTSSDGYFGYFADTPVVLGVGDKLQFTLKFQFSGLGTGTTLRFGILDSGGGARQTTDLTGGNSSAAWAGDNGYGLYTNLAGPTAGSAATNLIVVERTTLTASNPFSTGTDWTSLSSNSNVNITLADATVYTLSYSIERTSATDTLLIAGLSGGSIPGGWSRSVTDTSTSATQFDWFDFRLNSAASPTVWGAIKFTELEVTTTSAIPEPSTYALLLGAGTLAVAGVRRWRKAREVAV